MTAPPQAFERVGHRGAPREFTENTLPGFLRALDRGADAVELDVHVTADGVVVVHHDFDVRGRPIAQTSWERLRDAPLPGDARIPTLEDVLAAIGSRATVYVELKGPGIEDAVADVVRRSGHRYALHSFDHDAIARCARAHPEIPRGVLLDRATSDPLAMMARAVASTQPRDVWPHFTLVTSAFMAAAAAHGLRVIPWTVNDPEVARRAASLGVAGICTDDVRLVAS